VVRSCGATEPPMADDVVACNGSSVDCGFWIGWVLVV